MKKIILISAILLISNTLYSQELSVGARGGASIWTYATEFWGTPGTMVGSPVREQEVFVRYSLPKGFLLELSGGMYKLETSYSEPLFRDIVYYSKQECRNKEIRLSAQYNYVRFFKKRLHLYIGNSFSATSCTFTDEQRNVIVFDGPQPIIPYEKTGGTFWYTSLGLNHAIVYNIHKNISLNTTIAVKNDISNVAIPDMWFGDMSVSGLIGLSYKFQTN